MSSKITEAEWEVMEVIWENNPVKASDIIKSLGSDKWQPETIKTMLNRLVAKDFLTYEKEKNRYLYSPTLTREKCVKKEGQNFLNRVFKGATSSLLAHFVQNNRISSDDMKKLKKIIESAKS